MDPNESKQFSVCVKMNKNASKISIFGQKRKTKVNTKLRIKVVVYHENENLYFTKCLCPF